MGTVAMAHRDAEVRISIDTPLARVEINRPASRNALNLAVWRSLAERLPVLGARTDVRVVIVHGAGDEAFLAGADITEFPTARADATMAAAYERETHAALAALAAIPQPVIAMINGICFGGGCSVALACDLRFAADHARFAIPAARLGLAYPFSHGVESLVHLVGPAHAADILLSARVLDAQEALRIGLVNRVVPSHDLKGMTREYALRMAQGAPLSLAAHKAAIQAARPTVTEGDVEQLHALVARCFDSADYQEGVAAFLEKRRPRFTGR
jgi:enoyl-CoA hydratase